MPYRTSLQGRRPTTCRAECSARRADPPHGTVSRLGETGATLAVSPGSITAPVFIVDLIKRVEPNYFFAALTTIILILISYK